MLFAAVRLSLFVDCEATFLFFLYSVPDFGIWMVGMISADSLDIKLKILIFPLHRSFIVNGFIADQLPNASRPQSLNI